VFRCPNTRLAKYFSDHAIKNYLYRFALTVNAPLAQLANKSFHSAEIPYVFGNSYPLGNVPAEKAPFSRTLMGYWTRFAKTGDPNGGGAPTWAPYDNTTHVHLNLADPIVEGNDLATGCDFWESIPISAP
jgi:para-nitrobenzyl esterase